MVEVANPCRTGAYVTVARKMILSFGARLDPRVRVIEGFGLAVSTSRRRDGTAEYVIPDR